MQMSLRYLISNEFNKLSNAEKMPVELLHCFTTKRNYQKCLEKYPNNKEKCRSLEIMLRECLEIKKKINK